MDYNPFIEPRTKTIVLPRSGVTATVREVMLDEGMRFSEDFSGLSKDEQVSRTKVFIAQFITWDAKDRKTGEPLPVTAEMIGLLPVEDGNVLVREVMGFISPSDAKKGESQSGVS